MGGLNVQYFMDHYLAFAGTIIVVYAVVSYYYMVVKPTRKMMSLYNVMISDFKIEGINYYIVFQKDDRQYKLEIDRKRWNFMPYGSIVNLTYDKNFVVHELTYAS
jgi:hypothetical protein